MSLQGQWKESPAIDWRYSSKFHHVTFPWKPREIQGPVKQVEHESERVSQTEAVTVGPNGYLLQFLRVGLEREKGEIGRFNAIQDELFAAHLSPFSIHQPKRTNDNNFSKDLYQASRVTQCLFKP